MCYKPVLVEAPRSAIDGGSKYIYVNCRTCLECRQARANEWALRCYMEAQDYEANSFITLTYEKSPITLKKAVVQKFIKRLRFALSPLKIKYFACGEYGSKHYRPHYHILVFGYDFPDKYSYGKSSSGYPLYRSDKLDKLWGRGICTVQDMTEKTAAYSALYSSPPPHSLPKHLWNHPEFNLMSRGLGVQQILKNYDTYVKTDEIFVNGRAHNIPQCVLNKKFTPVDRMIRKEYIDLKARRIAKAQQAENNSVAAHGFIDEFGRKRYLAEQQYKRSSRTL